uniref:Uncharacterized protein n=1 Tax=Lactuca sativa TaxID=4236 RepID=A0A9R1VBE4_LACSA|nr:hypothetical protein LSAT_V11C600327930 [Lactuca sativa]
MIFSFLNIFYYLQIYFIQYKSYHIFQINLQCSIQLNFKSELCHIVIFVYLCMLNPNGLLLNILIRLFPAEIPNTNEDPELYSLVSEFMIHVDVNGYPLYMRRNNGYFVEKSGVKLDNRNIVPYNKYLLKIYQAYINAQWCN